MRVYDKKNCVNPWLGLLMIGSICIIISLAIFIEFGSSNIDKQVQRSGRANNNARRSHKMKKAAYITPYKNMSQQPIQKIVF